MGYLKNHWWKRWIRRRGCKLAGGPASVGKRTTLVLEEQVELGHLRIVPPRLEIGAYSYVRSGTDLSWWRPSGVSARSARTASSARKNTPIPATG